MLNLRSKDLKHIHEIAQDCLPTDIEIWAYGSRVNGNNHEASDLDLVLRGPKLEPIKLEILATFKDKLSQSNIPILIQVFDWACLPQSFHKNILENYHVLK